MDLCSPKRQQILTNKTILKRRFCKVCQGWQRVYMWHEIKVKMNMWQVNPTETQTRSVNVWTSTRSDLPPEIYMTHKISFILWKPQDFPETSHTRRDLKFCLTGLWCMKCCIKYTWHMTFLKNLCMKWNQDNLPLHPPFPFVLVNRKFVLHLGDSGTTQESWVIESLGESYHKYWFASQNWMLLL